VKFPMMIPVSVIAYFGTIILCLLAVSPIRSNRGEIGLRVESTIRKMADYAQTPLAKKLGIKPQHSVAILAASDGFFQALGPVPDGVSVGGELSAPHDLDVVVLFCRSKEELDDHLVQAATKLAPSGGLWVAWPKKSSGLPTDLAFASVQAAGLQLGLVDNKICAIDEVFSGLRFVVRRENRAAWAAGHRV
jgi:hypothetical protein